MPLWGDSEKKGYYMGGVPPRGVTSLSHILGAPVLRSNMERQTPHPCWLVSRPVGLTEGLWAGSTWEECENICLLLRQDRERRLKMCRWLTGFMQTPLPNLSEPPAPFSSCCSSTQEQELPWLKKELSQETQTQIKSKVESECVGVGGRINNFSDKSKLYKIVQY